MARETMGFDFGLDAADACFRRKYRWLFIIDEVSAQGVNCLAPSKAARPNVSFKEIEAQHLNETIYFPGKPDWKPITLVLYDNRKNNPIFDWLKKLYDPQEGTYVPSCDGFKKPDARLELYDGCGGIIETWNFDAVWPQAIDFEELDMSSSDVIMCNLTIRFDRAYIKSNQQQ